jgi:hypothetical protein
MNAEKRLIRKTTFLTKKVISCLFLLGRILPQLKIKLFKTVRIEKRFTVSMGRAAQLSTKRIICLFCAPMCVSKERRNEQKFSVVILALLLALYLI